MTQHQQMWDLADNLGVPLEWDHTTGTVRCKEHRKVEIGDLVVPVPLHVVSSSLHDNWAALLCRSLGNLCLLAVTSWKSYRVSVIVVDLAKLKGRPENFLEDRSPKTVQEAASLVSDGQVAVFHKVNDGWVREPALPC